MLRKTIVLVAAVVLVAAALSGCVVAQVVAAELH